MNQRQPLSERLFEDVCKKQARQIDDPRQIFRELEDEITHLQTWISVATQDPKAPTEIRNQLPDLLQLNAFYTTVLFRYLQKTQGVLKEGVQRLTDFNVASQSYRNQVDHYLGRFGVE